MQKTSKLMEMLIGYAAAHQHPINIAAHLIGIPIIMLGVSIPLTWASMEIASFQLTLAHGVVIALFAYYLSLDSVFAGVFLTLGIAIAELAVGIGSLPASVSGWVAAAAFFGGYLLQFIGHAIEKSMPVLVRHPVQANLAAPFFAVVEVFGLLGLRKDLFSEVQAQVSRRRALDTGAA